MKGLPPPVGLPYYGGKSLRGVHAPIVRRILDELPPRSGYAEPFSGGLGVLLARRRVANEIAGDRDGRVVNWWRAVRYHRDELHFLIRNTPQSQAEFETARGILDEAGPDAEIPERGDVRRAHAFFVVVSGSVFHGPEQKQFGVVMNGHPPRPRPEVHRLADRLRDVVLLREDGVRLLERLADRRHFSIFVDPPYASGANTSPYGCDVDRAALRDVLRGQHGAVIVSGYPDDGWDDLDWRRVEFPTSTTTAGGERSPRRECLWMNFGPTAKLF